MLAKLLQAHPVSVDAAALFLRLTMGLGMLTAHGMPKFERLMNPPVQFLPFMGLSPELSLILAIAAEIGCSLLVVLGLATRIATVPVMFTMLVAAFVAQAEAPFKEKELALAYLCGFAAIYLLGPGKYSLDAILGNKKQ